MVDPRGFTALNGLKQYMDKLNATPGHGRVNITLITEQLKKISGGMHKLQEENSYLSPAYLKYLLVALLVLVVVVLAALCWVLSDEWRQSQIKKRGYNKVGTQEVRVVS